MSKIIILKKGITSFDTECIVNTANEQLAYSSGVSELSEACDKIGYCNTGNAVITPSFNLKNNKFIIHAVGPKYSQEKLEKCRRDLYNVYTRSLEVMLENGCHTITFPLISSGNYGYPIKEAWEIAIKACSNFIQSNNSHYSITIYFAIIDDDKYKLGIDLLKDYNEIKTKNPVTKLYEVVSYLHRKWYEKLRITSEYSPSGCHFRCILSTKSTFDDQTGFTIMDDDNFPIYRYSSGQDYFYFKDYQSLENMTIDELGARFITECPELLEQSRGEDSEYVKWFEAVVQFAINGVYPYAFADHDYDIYKAKKIKLTDGNWIDYAPKGDFDLLKRYYSQN